MPVQVDPAGCGCTECLTGEYVPLEQATYQQVTDALHEGLKNATGETFIVTRVSVLVSDYGQGHYLAGEPRIHVKGKYSGLEWENP